MTEGWKTFLWLLALLAAFAAGLSPIIALLALGYGWHAARKVPLRGRRRVILL